MDGFDFVSLGEAVVEIFRKETDVPMRVAADFVGPYPSGAPLITTATMARLGCRCAFVATVGDDDFGECLVDRMTRDHIDVSGVRRLREAMTGLAFTSYFSDGSRKFIYNFKTAATAHLKPEHVDADLIRSSSWLHISGNVMAFSDSARESVIKAATVAHAHGVAISLDPNVRLEIMEMGHIEDLMRPVLERASVVLPSVGELAAIYGDDDEDGIIRELLAGGVKLVARKEGVGGCTLFRKGETRHVEALKGIVEVDPTGCGDAFCAGIVYGVRRGWGLEDIGVFATAVGAIAATRKGAMEGATGIGEVMDLLRHNDINLGGTV